MTISTGRRRALKNWSHVVRRVVQVAFVVLDLPAGTQPDTRVKDLVEDGQIVEVQVVRDAVTGLQGK